MKGFEMEGYLLAYIISNIIALLFLFASVKRPFLARALFILLFGWASWQNWTIALNTPEVYRDYADFAILPLYKSFITGWFSRHILLSVGFIATMQGLVAIGLLFRGLVFRLACIGGIIFLLAILPLGVGSAFPASLTGAIALAFVFRTKDSYIWQAFRNRKLVQL